MSLQEPVSNIKAHPSPSNILEWHYALEGSSDTEYEGGVYHGCEAIRPTYHQCVRNVLGCHLLCVQ